MHVLQVKARRLPQSISCGKTFRGHAALKAFPAVHRWLLELGHELEERIAADRMDNTRVPRLLTVRLHSLCLYLAFNHDGQSIPAC